MFHARLPVHATQSGSVATVTADGAHGSDAVYQTAARQYGPSPDVVIIPPRCCAVSSTEDPAAGPRGTAGPPRLAGRRAGPHGVAAGQRIRAAQPRRDGLYANDKFCLTRWKQLSLSWRRGPPRAERLTTRTGGAVSEGSCPFGADHEATALDVGAMPGQPSRGGAAVGPGLPAASGNADFGSGHPRRRSSDGHTGGEPPCT